MKRSLWQELILFWQFMTDNHPQDRIYLGE